MIESWHNRSSFENYFLLCNPLICTYSYLTRFRLAYIVATVVSLIGGLTVIIRIVSPQLLKLFRYLQSKCGSSTIPNRQQQEHQHNISK